MSAVSHNYKHPRFNRTPLAAMVSGILLSGACFAQAASPWDCRINSANGEWACTAANQGKLQAAEAGTGDLRVTTEASEQPQATDRHTQRGVMPTLKQDWVPISQLPQELHDLQCKQCGGAYLDPLRNEDQNKPEEADLVARAGSSELRGETLTLDDRVDVQQGYRQLRADKVTLDRNQGLATLEGNVQLREPGILLQTNRAEIRPDNGEATLTDSSYLLHDKHLRGRADTLHRDDQGDIRMDGGELTYCAPDDNDWSIAATKLTLYTEQGVAVARGSKLRLRGVPIFYLPYMRIPLDDKRRTGFLWPDIGSDSRSGIDIATPLYINLAPNYDALYTPRYIERRGVSHELTTNYLGKKSGLWTLGAAYLPGDRRFESDFPEESNHDRWFVQAQQVGSYAERWRSRIDYSKASDVNYLRDLDTASLDNRRQTNLLQLGSLDYLGDNWLVNMDVQQFQQLAEDIREDYRKLPQITGHYRSRFQPFSVNPILLAQYSNFDIDDPTRTTGQRIYGEAGASYPMRWQSAFLNSTAKYRYLDYDLRDEPILASANSPTTGSALASIDAGLFFERELQFAGRQLVQTLEPRVFYLYSEFKDQRDQPIFDTAELTFTYNQLFRETRFSGRDRLDDANQIAFGLTSRFLDGVSGKEYLSASLGQIYYFEDRRVRLLPDGDPVSSNSSEMAAELSYRPNDRLNLISNLVWDPNEDQINSGNVQLQYGSENGQLYSLGYTYRRPLEFQINKPVTEQTHLSFWTPIGGSNWRLFASWNYSVEAHTSVEDMVGIEYDTCCWKFRLMHLRYFDVDRQDIIIDPDDPNLERQNTTQAQILLKGLGGFGSRVSNLLEDMIRGYRDSEH